MFNEIIQDAAIWAEDIFQGSCAEDPRLSKRLIAYAAAQAVDPSASTAKACGEDVAAREGAYRFLENPRVNASSIDVGPRQKTAAACHGRKRVLAIQDTSDVSVCSNALREELASSGSPTGFLVHTALMADGETGEVLGVAEQIRWVREGRSKRQGTGPESDKWLLTDLSMRALLTDSSNVITVADREADLLPFLRHHVEQEYRFVIRAKYNRRLHAEMQILLDAAREAPVVGIRKIRVEQRGKVPAKGIGPGRPGRVRQDVDTILQARSLTIAASPSENELTLNVVRVSEKKVQADKPGQQDFEWVLLTTEPIATYADVEQIVCDYERRWLIEEFHKCWKTGCRLESRPLESLGAVEKMIALMVPIAVRLLQVHTAARSQREGGSMTTTFSDNELQCLWASTEKSDYPQRRPSAQWVMTAIAKLGGWQDTKRTGRVGWATLWDGWQRFNERLIGWDSARKASGPIDL